MFLKNIKWNFGHLVDSESTTIGFHVIYHLFSKASNLKKYKSEKKKEKGPIKVVRLEFKNQRKQIEWLALQHVPLQKVKADVVCLCFILITQWCRFVPAQKRVIVTPLDAPV